MTVSVAPKDDGPPSGPLEDPARTSPSIDTTPVMVESTPLGVRAALAEMKARFGKPLPENATLGMAETVLAEVLNNVVEHAYGPDKTGPIELRMKCNDLRLTIDVRDYGGPMPDGVLPGGGLPEDDMLTDGPAEGGYGWFLIRSFARNIEYARNGEQNRLTFCVPLYEEEG